MLVRVRLTLNRLPATGWKPAPSAALVELDDTWLRSQKPSETGRLEVWDAKVQGLVLRLTPTGAVSWSARLRTAAGKRTRPMLGAWPAAGIKEARKRALA